MNPDRPRPYRMRDGVVVEVSQSPVSYVLTGRKANIHVEANDYLVTFPGSLHAWCLDETTFRDLFEPVDDTSDDPAQWSDAKKRLVSFAMLGQMHREQQEKPE